MNSYQTISASQPVIAKLFEVATPPNQMDPLYLFACGTEWRLTGGEETGRELVRALSLLDTAIKCVAGAHLAEAGWRSMFLLNAAVASGELGLDETIPCVPKILISTRISSRADGARTVFLILTFGGVRCHDTRSGSNCC
jgi:hypothetical protein